ncbi:DUF4817 domain-containing protein [Trichonephila clavipes]|nr:DUF4817 domain-containing protein [Trichonephila clavipes]
MLENNEDVNVEDTVQTPKVSRSEGLKTVETVLQYFEQSASVIDLMFFSRLSDEAAKRRVQPGSTTIHHHISVSHIAAVGRADVCNCKSGTFICFGLLFLVSNATYLTVSDRGPRSSSQQEASNLHLSLSAALSTKQVARRRTVRTEEDIATVERSIEEDPNEFIRHRAQELDLCPSTLWKILWKDLGLRAYKIQLVQELKPNDHQARRRFVEWAQNEMAVVPDFHKRILLSDEAHFWLNGYVNKQNCRIWSEANPQVYVETPLHPEKLTVWCALWAGGILLQKR